MMCNDFHRLRSVLVNLLGNSVKYTFKGEIQLILERMRDKVDRTDECVKNNLLKITIKDTGIGIPKD